MTIILNCIYIPMVNKEYPAFELVNFDLREIREGSLIFVYGPRSSGKSTLICDIIQTNKWEKVVTVFATYLNKNLIVNGNLPKTQTEITDTTIDELCSNIDHKVVVIDGSAMGNMCPKKIEKITNKLTCNPKITLIMSLQFPMTLSQELQHKIDYSFFLRQRGISNRLIYRKYFTELLSPDSFDQVLNGKVISYNMLVIGKDKKIYSYCAKQYPSIKSE